MADVVYVGCKTPNGLVLTLNRYEVINKEQGTVRLVESPHAPVRLNGNRVGFGKPDLTIDGYMFTAVPKDFWEEWLKQNASSSLLTDRYIKAAISLDAGKRMAREHETERGQFAPLTEKDERTRSIPVTTADEQKSKGLAA